MFTIGAKAAIFNDAGEVLLCHSRNYDLWTLPGGGVEDEETPWEAIVREIKKETGLDVKIKRLAGVYAKEYEKDVVFNFECELMGGEITLAGKSNKIEYFNVGNLPSNTIPRQIERIGDVINSDKLVMKNQKGKSAAEILKAGMENINPKPKFEEDFTDKDESAISGKRLKFLEEYAKKLSDTTEKDLQLIDTEMNRIVKSRHFVWGKTLDLFKGLIVVLAPVYIVSFAISNDVVPNISDIQTILIKALLILLLFWIIALRLASFDSGKMISISEERAELINLIRKVRLKLLNEFQDTEEFIQEKNDKNSDKH